MNTDNIRVGTVAYHKLGDIGRDEDFFAVTGEDADNYYGNWLTGLGFVNVRFPKATTRELTDAERTMLAGQSVVIA
jgi:hypothetical protein